MITPSRMQFGHFIIIASLVFFSGCSRNSQTYSDYASSQYRSQADHEDLSGDDYYRDREAKRVRAANRQKNEARIKPEDTPAEICQKAIRLYVAANFSEAFKLFLEAAQKGDKQSQYYVARLYIDGKGVNKDLKSAREWYTQAAQQGDSSAQNNLAVMLTKGEGGKKNLKEAVQWLIKAAEQGVPVAQNNLGNKYRYGSGTKKDIPQARKWFLIAAGQGNEDARKSLAELDSEEQKAISKKATATKVKKAKKKSIDSGQDSEQIYSAAIACLNGKGVSQDYGKALQLFHEAEQKGNSSSAYYLGMMYEKGLGTPKDLKSAHAWYYKAAQNGDALAREKLNSLSK